MSTEDERTSQSNLLVPASIIVAGALIAFAVFYSSGSLKAPKTDTSPGTRQGSPNAASLAGDAPSLGNPAAPVTVVEFSDFQCPFCGRFFHTVEPQIKENYVKTGKVRFVYRNFSFLGQESDWAAEAAACANKQGKFWEYHDYLFNHQNGENQGAFTKDNLKSFAKALNLDTAAFSTCLDSDTYLAAVHKDTDAGRQAGVNGTPGTFVNGKLITGALPYEQFQSAIEDALKAK